MYTRWTVPRLKQETPKPISVSSGASPAAADGYRRLMRQHRDEMRLSRHAKNELRLYRLQAEDVAAALEQPLGRESDERGNARIVGEARDGRRILVIVAGDDPDFVITVFLRS